ncbi:hypothetical protein ANTQUA_LOCUS9366 [Anthophora quadrimaculata]
MVEERWSFNFTSENQSLISKPGFTVQSCVSLICCLKVRVTLDKFILSSRLVQYLAKSNLPRKYHTLESC